MIPAKIAVNEITLSAVYGGGNAGSLIHQTNQAGPRCIFSWTRTTKGRVTSASSAKKDVQNKT